MKRLAPELARNGLSMVGAALVTLSAVLFLFVYLLDLFGMHTNPYIGIVFFLIMPAVFIFGLLLIPLGMWRERKARLAGKTVTTRWPVVDLNNLRTLRTALVVAILTIVNVLIVSLAAFRGIEYMDSVSFCGQTCHEVMQPEYASYQAGPHARVRCVECHIGSGASWFVKSKISGARQLYAVAFNTHSRPIPSPVHDLRPARDTCEQCHWPEKFHGDKIRAFREYADDQANTESVNVMRLHVGGGSESLGRVKGIHWHTSRSNVIEYIATDDKRQVIPWVRLTTPDGRVKEWTAAGVSAAALAKGERRRMDCMDCHNRPSHQFFPSAERAVDQAIALGVIDRGLPFVRREGVRLLKAAYPDQPAAFAAIRSGLETFYRANHADVLTASKDSFDRAVDALQHLYGRSVFPSMKVTFGTYANNLGHNDFPGCFRCHDDSHKSKDGTSISQDCEMCHAVEDIPASASASVN
jgi:nitrate/TMAO reductase-like tetraheme cytochrome c subunit